MEPTSGPANVHLECVVGASPELPPIGPAVFLRRLQTDIDLIRRLSGLPVIMENSSLEWVRTDANPRGNGGQGSHGSVRSHNAQFASDPAFIAEALDVTRTGLLLDLSHAQTTAWHRGEPTLSYLNRLPLRLVQEIHISGPAMVQGELRDRHLEVQDDGYDLLAEVLPATEASVVSLEYGGFGPLFEDRSTLEALERQLRRLRKVLERFA